MAVLPDRPPHRIRAVLSHIPPQSHLYIDDRELFVRWFKIEADLGYVSVSFEVADADVEVQGSVHSESVTEVRPYP